MTNFFRASFIIGDWLVLNLSIALANLLYLNSWFAQNKFDSVYLIIYSNLAWVFLVLISDSYNVSRNWFISKALKSQLAFIFIHSLVVISLVILFKKNYPFLQIILIYSIFIPLFFALKVLLYNIRLRVEKKRGVRKFILIGINELSREIRKYFLINYHLKYQFIGYYNLSSPDSMNEIKRICIQNEVNEIFYCVPDSDSSFKSQLIDFGLDSLIQVKLFVDSNFDQSQLIQLEKGDQFLPLNIATVPLDDSRNQFLKRTFDILFSLFVIIFILSWLLPIAAILIKLDSRGPVFFVQTRTGQNDVKFNCLKLRTMILNKEADTKQATEGDPRITKIGALMRRTCIDEFPQFFNVLKGSMSTVGPRPFMLKHREEYGQLIERFMGRHYVKPGVTGLAQCLGYRGEIKGLADMENRVRLDRHYIGTWSFWKDIKVIVWTVISIINGQ